MKKYKKDFYYVTNYENYAVNKKGVVINVKKDDKVLDGNVNPAGYKNYRLTNDEKTTTLGIHTILKRTFDYFDGCEDYIVNHKDGDKTNFNYSNLEWGTQQYNMEHAGDKGLTSKCKPVIIIEKNGKETKYPSIVACSRKTGLGVDAISYRIYSTKGKVFNDGRIYKFKEGTKI